MARSNGASSDVLAEILELGEGQLWGDAAVPSGRGDAGDDDALRAALGLSLADYRALTAAAAAQKRGASAAAPHQNPATASKAQPTDADTGASRKRGRASGAAAAPSDGAEERSPSARILRPRLDAGRDAHAPPASLVPAVDDDEAWTALAERLSAASPEVAPLIAAVLEESNVTSLSLAVEALGVPAAIALLRAAMAADARGGVLTADGSRRRSPGGVFFLLLKERLDPEAYKACFQHKTAAHTAAVNARRRRVAAGGAAAASDPRGAAGARSGVGTLR